MIDSLEPKFMGIGYLCGDWYIHADDFSEDDARKIASQLGKRDYEDEIRTGGYYHHEVKLNGQAFLVQVGCGFIIIPFKRGTREKIKTLDTSLLQDMSGFGKPLAAEEREGMYREIQRLAYALHLKNPSTNPDENWFKAKEILVKQSG